MNTIDKDQNRPSLLRLVVVSLYLGAVLIPTSRAFEIRSPLTAALRKQSTSKSQLHALGTLPTDMFSHALSSSWYNEYNPTARRTVYDE